MSSSRKSGSTPFPSLPSYCLLLHFLVLLSSLRQQQKSTTFFFFVVEAAASASDSADCSTGISNGKICCSSSCGECSGSGCSGREGGALGCCGSAIRESEKSCLDNPPPCVMDLGLDLPDVNDDDPGGYHYYPVNPFCAPSSSDLVDGSGGTIFKGGIRDVTTGACCLESCGSCGEDTIPDREGKICHERSGGAKGCCVADIIANYYEATATTTPSNNNNTLPNDCEVNEPPCYSQIENGITFENYDWKQPNNNNNNNNHTGSSGHSHQQNPYYWHPLNQVINSSTKCGTTSESSSANNNNNNNNQCLEITFEPSDRGSERVSGLTPLPRGLEYTLTYDVKFDENFEFVKGGKLHGLGPAQHVSGCSPMSDTGWSARVMWIGEEGQIIIYVYHQDKKHNCGHGFKSNAYFTRGQWETISLYVKVNSAYDVFDGKVQLYLNGILITEALDLRFVDDPEWAAPYHSEGYIANFIFSAFHGGSNTDWSPTKPQKAYIDNISVLPGHAVPTPPLAMTTITAATTTNATDNGNAITNMNYTTNTNNNNTNFDTNASDNNDGNDDDDDDDGPAISAIARTMRLGLTNNNDKAAAKAATVLPAPKSYDAHEMSCEDEDAMPFDDYDYDYDDDANNAAVAAATQANGSMSLPPGTTSSTTVATDGSNTADSSTNPAIDGIPTEQQRSSSGVPPPPLQRNNHVFALTFASLALAVLSQSWLLPHLL